MLRSLALFALIASAIAFAWQALGRPIAMPPSPLHSGGKLTCISYAPFHGDQAPFTWNLVIPDGQIEGDLRRLAAMTPCVRTYSARGPQGRIARLAEEAGLEVLQGIWLGRNRADNRREIEAALKIARRHPDTVKALIVGNETLLRGELPQERVRAYLDEVKRRSGLPVTYADVWEFWLKAPELAEAADFVTIHILPYWEDDPVSEEEAVAHVREVRERVAAAFPGKEIVIGEVGWPSRGRMRESALPSHANQARFVSGVVQLAQDNGWKLNVVEAFDQPWKRLMEGTVGGYWGLYDGVQRAPKFRFGEAVSNHPDWRLKAGLGIGAAFLVFLAFWSGSRGVGAERSWRHDAGAAAIALGAGLLFGLAAVNLPLEGETSEDRLRALGILVLALAVPLAASFAWARGIGLVGFATALDPSRWRQSGSIPVMLAPLFAATVVAAIHVALGLVFDPRYKDFPFAALTGPVIALAVLALADREQASAPGIAERVAAALLAGSALFIVGNEGLANWQALIFAALLLLLALTCLKAEAAPG
ncbi:MAG TPA: beta-1,6-glucan synthase [Methyloceanibacter sp.]|nr:beta-1,6-glucan synthase [Methyloceanibacter sp.]